MQRHPVTYEDISKANHRFACATSSGCFDLRYGDMSFFLAHARNDDFGLCLRRLSKNAYTKAHP